MKRALFALAVPLIVLFACADRPAELAPGSWRAWLDSPGGELPFGLELTREGPIWRATLINGPERQEIEKVTVEPGRLLLDIEHYDAHIEAVYTDPGRLDGRWWKTGKGGTVSALPFHASHGVPHRFAPLSPGGVETTDLGGRWAVQFADDVDVSVGLFEHGEGNQVHGTFLNATGDFRYLAGTFEAGRLRLSVFDGAHAFLFDATLEDDGSLRGDFWSRESYHDTWTAVRDDTAEILPATEQVSWLGEALAKVAYPDLEGNLRSLDDPEFSGAARILVVFGSWCPNCNDATADLVELHARYRDRGLSVLGLAFEMTGDFQRDAEQVRVYRDYHGIEYPLLIAGTADKADASLAFPLIDRIKSFPTTIFLDGNNRVHTVHSGYSGPATGQAHFELKAEFTRIVEELLGDGD